MRPKSNMERQALHQHLNTLSGTLIAVDPSSGSAGSLPGFAVYREGVLIESGMLDIPRSGPIWHRLQALRTSLDALVYEYKPELLAVEHVFIKGNSKSMTNLQRAIGVIMSCAPGDVIEVGSTTWRKHIPEGYWKADDNDAVAIGYAVIEAAARLTGREPPQPPWAEALGLQKEEGAWTKSE